jgi:hypothetical protein
MTMDQSRESLRLDAAREKRLGVGQLHQHVLAPGRLSGFTVFRSPYVNGRPVGCIATAQGWQGAVNSLVALRQIVHALALDVEGGLDVTDPAILASIDLIAGQILDFTSARSARERAGEA